MNYMLCKIAACAVLLLAGTAVSAKDWRGIVPLKSTRADVERLFGVQKQTPELAAFYKLPNELVVFHFQNFTCDSEVGKWGYGWNVPLGTVVYIGVIPTGNHRKDEYQLASDVKVQDSGGGIVYYTDNVAGWSIETYQNSVTLIEYYPEASQHNSQCPQIQQGIIDFFPIFDEYGKLSFEDEKARLDNFVINMKEGLGRGTIEVRGPTKKDRQQLMKQAARAKSYLVKKRGLEPERLLVIEGGFWEKRVTRLSLYSIGGVPSRIYLHLEPDPEMAFK